MVLAGIIMPPKVEWRRFAAGLNALAEAVEQAAGTEDEETDGEGKEVEREERMVLWKKQ